MPHWIGTPLYDKTLTTYLDRDPEIIECQVLMGAYFFISKDRVIHENHLYTVVKLMGDLGGISVMCFNAASFFAFIYSVQFFWGELIHQIFYVYNDNQEENVNLNQNY